jgi:hypothetical protein
VHVIHASRDGIARTEIVSHPTAQVESKREVLSLRILHPFGTLSVNAPEAEASIKVGRNSPVTPDKVASNTLIAHPLKKVITRQARTAKHGTASLKSLGIRQAGYHA